MKRIIRRALVAGAIAATLTIPWWWPWPWRWPITPGTPHAGGAWARGTP